MGELVVLLEIGKVGFPSGAVFPAQPGKILIGKVAFSASRHTADKGMAVCVGGYVGTDGFFPSVPMPFVIVISEYDIRVLRHTAPPDFRFSALWLS